MGAAESVLHSSPVAKPFATAVANLFEEARYGVVTALNFEPGIDYDSECFWDTRDALCLRR